MKTNGQLESTGALSKLVSSHRFQRLYKDKTEAEYEQFLKSSNLFEIQSHAVEVGISPSKDRGKLERSLKTKYRKTLSETNGNLSP